MRHVFETMGTVASLEVSGEAVPLIPLIERTFQEFDERFSLYRPDSELSRISRGECVLSESSDVLLASYVRALAWRGRTGGAFSPHRPDGVVDLNGIVKAEAIEAAGELLDTAGCTPWSITVGGDILVRGTEPTTLGIVDPRDRGAILCAVELRLPRRALATSGSAERGDHVWLGSSREPAHFVQVSVIADDIVTADVLATAVVAGGTETLDRVTAEHNIDVLAIDRAGELVATPGFRGALAAA